MPRLEILRNANSIKDLASLLGYEPKYIAYILFKLPDRSKYSTFEIPKKNGTSREIQAPTVKLKKLQSKLATLLSDCFDEIHKSPKNSKSFSFSLSHGFRRHHSIVTNASNHRNKRYVFNVDLMDFFHSINFGRVRGYFIKNKHFNLNPKVSTIIAQIACFNNKLPQGSPCSPIISNLIAHILDVRLVNLAKRVKCTYSRYADDITFSTNKKDFPFEIAFEENNNWFVGSLLNQKVEHSGFYLNNCKTTMQYKTARQLATGLVVNNKINVKNEYYRKARAFWHSLLCRGSFEIPRINSNPTKGTLNQLGGILNFIFQIKKLSIKDKKKPTGIIKLYRQFLHYKNFYFPDKPLIICEGKTDVIHLKCALKKLSKDYSELFDGEKYKIRFFRFSNTVKEILDISEGIPGLSQIISKYENWINELEKCRNNFINNNRLENDDSDKPLENVMRHPVIIVLDTDALGSKQLSKGIEDKMRDEDKNIIPFSLLTKNLYFAFISKEENKEIEDLFDKQTLDKTYQGKSFSRSTKSEKKMKKSKEKNMEYGKTIFAEKIILPNKDKINFERFNFIFSNIKNIISKYQNTRN